MPLPLRRLTMGQLLSYGLTGLILLGLLVNIALTTAEASTSAYIFTIFIVQLLSFMVLLGTYSKSYMSYGLAAKIAIPTVAGLSLVLSLVYITA